MNLLDEMLQVAWNINMKFVEWEQMSNIFKNETNLKKLPITLKLIYDITLRERIERDEEMLMVSSSFYNS